MPWPGPPMSRASQPWESLRMATWEALKSYLLSNLEGEEKSPRVVAVTNVFPDGEHRVTFVSSAQDHDGNPWVSIDSLVTTIGAADVVRAVRLAGEKVCGGLATMPIGDQEYLVLRHAMPIEQLGSGNIGDFRTPFLAVTGAASGLARELAEVNSL
jgi:hypothetical protein